MFYKDLEMNRNNKGLNRFFSGSTSSLAGSRNPRCPSDHEQKVNFFVTVSWELRQTLMLFL